MYSQVVQTKVKVQRSHCAQLQMTFLKAINTIHPRADPEQCCWGGARTVGDASSTARSAVERVRPRQREVLAKGAAAGVWGCKNRSPRVLECT